MRSFKIEKEKAYLCKIIPYMNDKIHNTYYDSMTDYICNLIMINIPLRYIYFNLRGGYNYENCF